jgi:hypothetical protein
MRPGSGRRSVAHDHIPLYFIAGPSTAARRPSAERFSQESREAGRGDGWRKPYTNRSQERSRTPPALRDTDSLGSALNMVSPRHFLTVAVRSPAICCARCVRGSSSSIVSRVTALDFGCLGSFSRAVGIMQSLSGAFERRRFPSLATLFEVVNGLGPNRRSKPRCKRWIDQHGQEWKGLLFSRRANIGLEATALRVRRARSGTRRTKAPFPKSSFPSGSYGHNIPCDVDIFGTSGIYSYQASIILVPS